jgi:uncharacterized protein
MLESLMSYHLSPFQWTIAVITAVIVGIGKSGLNSISTITVALLAWTFGSKISTGILLPMLIVGDTLAVFYYKRHVEWKPLFRLIPWALIGVLIAAWVGKDLDEAVFKKIMAVIIIIIVAGMFWLDRNPTFPVPKSLWFSGSMGLATGFTTMIGNQAGGFATMYWMSLRLSKNNFIGTHSWLFLFINIFKLPFHIFTWKTIDFNSLSVNLVLLPSLLFGFYTGVYIVKNIQDKHYNRIILWLTALAAVFVFF